MGGFYYAYHVLNSSEMGTWMGMYQLLMCLFVDVYAAGTSFMGIFETMMLWDKFDEIQSSGEEMTKGTGYKFFTIGWIIGTGAWIGA